MLHRLVKVRTRCRKGTSKCNRNNCLFKPFRATITPRLEAELRLLVV